MLKITRVLALPVLTFACALIAPAASAQPARVFVGAQGSDANPCTFARHADEYHPRQVNERDVGSLHRAWAQRGSVPGRRYGHATKLRSR
jgi:hypothetical protein